MTPGRAKAARQFAGDVVVIASHNPGKFANYFQLLEP